MAMHSAARASAASWWMSMANPGTRRECRSMIDAILWNLKVCQVRLFFPGELG
jgi:hypothetical protein